MRGRILAAAAAAVLGPAAGAAPAQAGPGCGPTARPWEARGPYAVATDVTLQTTVYRPKAPGTLGCVRHPVVLWGNGSGKVPRAYRSMLRSLASHGFLVVAANTGAAGTGEAMLEGIDVAAARDAAPGDPLRGHVDLAHVGAAGHSQGGGGAIHAGADPRVDTVVALQPLPLGGMDLVHGPALLLAGDRDPVIPPAAVAQLFSQARAVPAAFGVLAGADHGTAALTGGGYRGAIITWLRFELMADERARSQYFGGACRQCTSPLWRSFRRNPRATAVPGPQAAQTARGVGLRLRCAGGGRVRASLTGPVLRVRGARFVLGPSVRELTQGPWRVTVPRAGGDVIVRVVTDGDLARIRRTPPACA